MICQSQCLFIAELIYKEVGKSCRSTAVTSDHHLPSLGSGDEPKVFDTYFGTVVGAAGNPHLKLPWEFLAVVTLIEFQPKADRVKLATFAEGGARAYFNRAHTHADDGSCRLVKFLPDLIQLVFLK